MKCSNCGSELRNGARFCRICGSPIEEHHSPAQNDNVPFVPANRNQYAGSSGYKPKSHKRGKKKLAVILTSAVSLVLVAALVITIIAVNRSRNDVDYKKFFRVYKEELQQVKSDIENYADHYGIDEKERNLVAVSPVLGNTAPSLFYVVEGQDSDGNDVPVIKICEAQNDTAQSVFESMIDFSPVDRICIIRNSQTGDTYLFTDSEYPDVGNVAVYSLFRENNVIKQAEKFRFTYEWQTADGEDYYDYQYFIDQNSVEKDAYNRAIEEFVPKIDTVIISVDNGRGAADYNYFKNIASVAMSYDDAIDYLDKGINGAAVDEPAPKTEIPTTIEYTELNSIDDLPGDYDKEFGLFYFYNSKPKNVHDEHYYEERCNFDCENPDTYHDYLIDALMPFITPVRLFDYPGENSEQVEKGPDPLNKYGGDPFSRVSYEKMVWIVNHIFHVPQDEIDEMIAYACENTDIYVYEENGKKYLISHYLGGDPFNADRQYKKILTDGTNYYLLVEYNLDKTKGLPTETYYVKAAYEKIDGQNYWTMYRHTLDVPDSMKEYMTESNSSESDNLQEEQEENDSDIFSMFEGSYTFTSGVGAWSTQLELKSDGTFTGEYHDTDAGARGDGYDATLYLAKFSGRFKDPQKVNDYTYSFKLDEIYYENEPDTEEIGDPYDSGGKVKVLMKYSAAYGLSGAETVYAYMPSAPTAELPDKFMLWVDHLRDKNTRYGSELSYKCLYAVETEQGWIGQKE